MYIHVYLGIYVEVRRQLWWGLPHHSSLYTWVPGMKLWSSDLGGKCFSQHLFPKKVLIFPSFQRAICLIQNSCIFPVFFFNMSPSSLPATLFLLRIWLIRPKSVNLSLIPRTHLQVEERTDCMKLSSDLHSCVWIWCHASHTQADNQAKTRR